MHRKNVMREAVEKADDDQDQGIRDHDGLIADPVNDFSDDGGSEEAADGGYGRGYLGMSMCYWKGNGAPKDTNRAIELAEKADRAGAAEAKEMLRHIRNDAKRGR